MTATLSPLMQLNEACVCRCDTSRAEQVLLATGVDVNAQHEDGTTVLINVVTPDEHGDLTAPTAVLRMVRFLLERGADPTIRDRDGRDALAHANDLLDPEWRDVFGRGYPGEWLQESRTVLEEIVAALHAYVASGAGRAG
jgi:ankyrin repeat protein